ncbi:MULTISPECIES: hypothetical protein [Streptomyces]|uniref:hypothetical protein n=1 Tax=Streptomyces TaxID=1883 RepID=UPI00142F6214|nr:MULTISPECIES: hypothetical protein [Streptomyces]
MATETSPTTTAEPASVPYRRGEDWPVSFLEPLALTADEERALSAGLAVLFSSRRGGSQ